VELLVVVAILGALLSLVFPAVQRAYVMAMRTACNANVRRITEACLMYARKQRYHIDTGADAFPSVAVGDTGWSHVLEAGSNDPPPVGNAACLWLLVRYNLAARELFLCPEAATRLGWRVPGDEDISFTYDTDNNISTLSYSYMSMLIGDQAQDPDEDAPPVNMREVSYLGPILPASMVIIADKNPRVTFNDDDDQLTDNPPDFPSPNSYNHDQEGQNVGKIDGSAVWVDESESDLTDSDDIYAARELVDDQNGWRTDPDDTFCIP